MGNEQFIEKANDEAVKDATDIYETGCKDCIHAPICEYCADRLENFRLPTDPHNCVMYHDSLDGVNEETKTAGGIKYNSPYECTVVGMLSPDYKERFKAEYQQTKIRYEKLKAFCNRIEAAMRTCPGDTKRVAMPEHDCPLELLRDQQRAMGEYLHCLEIRAVIEGIDL